MMMTVIGKETSHILKRGAGKPAIDADTPRPFRIVSFVASTILV
jgi:hypothetical protein